LNELGLSSQWCAGCQGRAAQMDLWGVVGCRQNFDTIVKWMEEGYSKLNWLDWGKTVTKCVRTGMVFSLNPLDPCRSLVEEVLRRCEAQVIPPEPETPLVQLQVPPVVLESPTPPVVVEPQTPVPTPPSGTPMIWSYGVTTVPARRSTLLPQTLTSLAAAGFDKPRLFVDGCNEQQNWERDFGLEVSCRYPNLGVAGSWTLALMELILREPNAHRYAIFQDDCITYRNLRQFLEKSPYPEKGYLNLITELHNEGKAKKHSGWFPAAQLGLGAVGLVFSREAASILMSTRSFIERSQDTKRGHIAIDGGVLYAMQNNGWKEYCHNPSLVQHIGHKASTMGHTQIPQT